MPSVTMPTFSTPAPLAASMTVDDVAVAQRSGARDEHRLVLARFEDVRAAALELGDGHVLLVDRDLLVGRVLEHDLADVDFLRLVARSWSRPAG